MWSERRREKLFSYRQEEKAGSRVISKTEKGMRVGG
jgi:hypothetical protein